ncbi:hypothetical protein PTTG_12219 [Puccinia triticina 1-1 BBBD Race 1]|uniref:CCHC-type domain-containing protein n=1 Tax=Puccinia triticina (isolate 1-1 / race 1 (BBBD)) TaxID=630390 RepID=A0A180GT05_PUCT1|nr:hypothetical protein PTTG_12219 [Puccinia triticina 1-1 BBBD Race 1]
MDTPPHLSVAQRAADLAEAKAQLEESKIVGQAVHAATSNSPAAIILAVDGSNFEVWSRELGEKAGIHLSDKEFFDKKKTNSVLEKIGRAIFLAMIHESLKSDVHGASSCNAIYDLMFKKFKSVSRAAQLDVFYRFIEFKNSANPTAAGAASTLKDLATEWRNLKVDLTVDVFMGFVLQSSIGRDTPLGQDFDRQVEQELQQSEDCTTPTFDRLVQLLSACKLQDDHTRPSDKTTSSTGHSPAIHQSTADLPPFNQSAFLADIPEVEWPAALEFYQATANRCWSCGDVSHYLCDCPNRSRSTPVNRRQRGPGTLSYRPVQAPRQQFHQAPFMPMIGAVYPPPSLPYGQPQFQFPPGQHTRQQFGPTQFFQQYPMPYPPAHQHFQNPPSQQHQQLPLRPADSYRPSSAQHQRQNFSQMRTRPESQRGGGASAKEANVPSLPDGVADVDFGAMTAELDLLHNFQVLKSPIALNVATSGAGAYISGAGELSFRGPGDTTVTISGVLFCEQACSTLISLAALRKANWSFDYDNPSDCFNISNAKKELVFRCPFERIKNRWCIPLPIIKRPNFLSVSSLFPPTSSSVAMTSFAHPQLKPTASKLFSSAPQLAKSVPTTPLLSEINGNDAICSNPDAIGANNASKTMSPN